MRKVIDLTEPKTETIDAKDEQHNQNVLLQEKEIDFIVTMIQSGKTLKEIGEGIMSIYKQRKPRKRTPEKYYETQQTTGSEEVKMPTKQEITQLRIMSESATHERNQPDTNPPDSRSATPEKKEQLKESFVLPPDAENIIRILSQRLQNTVEVKIQYIVDEKRIIQIGATTPLYDRTIEKAHDELYVTVLKSLNSLIAKTV